MRHAGDAGARIVVSVALAAAAWLGTGQPASASSRRPDDRVRLRDGTEVDTAAVKLSDDQVAAIRRTVYALRPNIGLGVGPACTGTAISEKLLLTAGHCAFPGGMRAYQKHLRPRPRPVHLELVHREFDKHTGADIAIFERKKGKFLHYLRIDTGFDFAKLAQGDRFGFPAFPYEKWNVFSWPQTRLLFSPVSLSHDGGSELWFGVETCRDPASRAAPSNAGARVCRIRFRATFYDGNSGSPMLRIHRENGVERMTVVAVGTVGAKPTARDGSLGSVAAPTSLLRDVLGAVPAPPEPAEP